MYITFKSDEQSELFSAASPPTAAAPESAKTNPTGPPEDRETERETLLDTGTKKGINMVKELIINLSLINNKRIISFMSAEESAQRDKKSTCTSSSGHLLSSVTMKYLFSDHIKLQVTT